MAHVALISFNQVGINLEISFKLQQLYFCDVLLERYKYYVTGYSVLDHPRF